MSRTPEGVQKRRSEAGEDLQVVVLAVEVIEPQFAIELC